MGRKASAGDFTETVEGIGAFVFGKRAMRDQFSIHSEFARLTEGVSPVPPELDITATAVATLKVLTVSAPDDWNIDEMDPLEEDTYAKIMKVYGVLRAREESFRKRPKAVVKAKGEGAE